METLNIANLDNAFAHSSSETRWLIRMGFILNILRVNPRKLRRGNPLEKLGGSDSYKIDYSAVAAKSRCVTRN